MMPEIAKASLGFTGAGNEQFGQQREIADEKLILALQALRKIGNDVYLAFDLSH